MIVFNFKVNYVRGIKIDLGGGYKSSSAGTSGLKIKNQLFFTKNIF